jgi:hypothetical protein
VTSDSVQGSALSPTHVSSINDRGNELWPVVVKPRPCAGGSVQDGMTQVPPCPRGCVRPGARHSRRPPSLHYPEAEPKAKDGPYERGRHAQDPAQIAV